MIKFLTLFILISANLPAADSVTVETKTYTAVFKDEYRNDTAYYNLPVITAGAETSLITELNSYLKSDSILFDNIDSTIMNYKMCGCGTVGSDYKVLYNKNGVLSISIVVETMGAYPDTYYSDVNLNLVTGKKLLITDIIFTDKTEQLANKLDKIVQQRITSKLMETLKDNMEAEINSEMSYIRKLFSDDHFTEENLSNFAVKDGGIMFYFNYGLPHVAKALSPDEDIWMTNEELSGFYTEYGKSIHR